MWIIVNRLYHSWGARYKKRCQRGIKSIRAGVLGHEVRRKGAIFHLCDLCAVYTQKHSPPLSLSHTYTHTIFSSTQWCYCHYVFNEKTGSERRSNFARIRIPTQASNFKACVSPSPDIPAFLRTVSLGASHQLWTCRCQWHIPLKPVPVLLPSQIQWLNFLFTRPLAAFTACGPNWARVSWGLCSAISWWARGEGSRECDHSH